MCRRSVHGYFPILAIGAVFTDFLTVILSIAIPIVWAAGTITVSAITIIVAIPAIVLSRGVVPTAAWRRTTTASTRRATTTGPAFTITARVEAPGCRWRSSGPLDLQEVVPTNALVVHLMVGFICITTALILNEGKETAGSSARCWDIATNKATIAVNSGLAPNWPEGKEG